MQINTIHELFAFLKVQKLLDAEKHDIIVQHIQHLSVKYFELNATFSNKSLMAAEDSKYHSL